MPTYHIDDFGADGDGVANDAPAFVDFNEEAAGSSDPVNLFLRTGGQYRFTTNVAQFWCKNIPLLNVSGGDRATTAIINDTGGDQAFFLGGSGLTQDNTHSARVGTVSRGERTITLESIADAGKFSVSRYALLAGFDLQGIFGAAYGFPPNPHYFQYVYITDISGDVITVLGLVNDTFKSAWPNYNSGNAFEIDSGGPATLYALDPSWNAEAAFSGFTIDNPDFQTYANLRKVRFYNVACTGANGIIPSQNLEWTADNCDLSSCIMEVDKLIHSMRLKNTNVNQVKVQSSSVDIMTIEGTYTISRLDGSAKRTFISGTGPASFQPGAFAYGRSDFVQAKNCVIPAIPLGSFAERGPGDIGIDQAFSLAANVISYPNGKTITGAADNGSGKVRLTLNNTTGLVTGMEVNISNVGGTTEVNGGNREITKIDGTHVDLLGINFSHAFTSNGILGLYAPRWAVPGTVLLYEGGACEVVAVTQTADNTLITVDSLAELPTLFRPSPCPHLTFENVTGCEDAVSFSSAPPGSPIYAYQTRAYTSGVAQDDTQAKIRSIGRIVSVSINVTHAYGGAGALSFHLSEFDNWPVTKADGSSYDFGPIINAKVAGERIITADGVTGTQTGDSGLTIPEAFWFNGESNSGPKFSADVSGTDAAVRVVVTIRTDQEHSESTFVCTFS